MILFNIPTLICLFLSLCSAFDNFQGLGSLSSPCFPVFDHSECNTTLVQSYVSPIKPISSNIQNTLLFLFTSKNPDKAEQLHLCGGRLPPNSTYDPNCRTEIFIHGFADELCRTAWMREMKEQLFLRNSCYNVILVDWSWGNFPDFVSASINVRIVGAQVGYSMIEIANQTGCDCSNFHVTGHSFGAAVASYVGKTMQKECKLGCLTALDDANSPFLDLPISEYLNPTDATLVVTVHTNSGDCILFQVGNPRPLGHINFFMNDGSHQYSCYAIALQSFLKLDILNALVMTFIPAFCYHNQALQYYKASIQANKDDTMLIGVQCPSYEDMVNGKCERNCEKEGRCLPMGLDTPAYVNYSDLSNDLNDVKIYYVPTSLTCPYADHSGFTGLPLKPFKKQETPN